MPFWLGMLIEEQHPYEPIQKAIQQASYDIFFKSGVLPTPPYVADPGLDLEKLLGGQKIRILGRSCRVPKEPAVQHGVTPREQIKAIRRRTNQSWSNL